MSNRKKRIITLFGVAFALIILWVLYTLLFSMGMSIFGLIISLMFDLQFSYLRILTLSGTIGAFVITIIALANRKAIKEEIDNCFPKE